MWGMDTARLARLLAGIFREWHEQKNLAHVAGYCARLERVLVVALHHQRSHFIAKSFEPNNVDGPDDGVTLDRRMADVLGRTRTGSINRPSIGQKIPLSINVFLW